MSRAEHDAQLERQGGRCALCRETPTHALAIDHCHETGLFRGLLCHNCNLLLGHAKDQPEVLRRAAEYLEEAMLL